MEPLIDPVCACLDDYLDGEMSGDEAVQFETHLHDCPVCREAVAQQRWINGTLQDGAAATPAPDVLLVVVSREISQERRRRRRRVLAGGLAAAASVAFIAAWAWHRSVSLAPGSTGGANDQTIVQREATPRWNRGLEERIAPAAEPSLAPAAATFVAGGDGVAVPLESDSPEVTVVQFYPTTEADRRARRQRELETQYRELIGG